MNTDKTTTLLGFVKAIIGMIVAGLIYFSGVPIPTEAVANLNGVTDWLGLLVALYSIVTAIVGYFTNKPSTVAAPGK